MFVGQGGQRRNYSLELVGAGLATLDERKLEYGEVPKMLMDAMAAAQKNRVGIWSIEQKTDDKKTVQVATKSKAEVIKVTISEIRSGSHFFYQLVGDKSAKVVDDSMKKFTKDNGTAGAPCDVKPGKVVAALFDDGTGKSWYRAKILTRGERGKVQVLFVDHGNVAAVPLASHLRPLDITLGTDRIPAVAHEAELALTLTRPISDDEGLEAARMLQKLAWGKELIATKYCDLEGKAQVALKDLEAASSINEQLVSAGLARVAKQPAVNVLSSRMLDGNELTEFAAELNVAQDAARKFRSGMWRYGDIGDEDDEE
jgi:staphylococcal nuclease domain-containing protein 1